MFDMATTSIIEPYINSTRHEYSSAHMFFRKS